MKKKGAASLIVGLIVTIFIGSFVLWAVAAVMASLVCLFLKQWGLAALFGLAGFLWGYCGYFLLQPILKGNQLKQTTEDSQLESGFSSSVSDRRAAAIIGINIGCVIGLSLGLSVAPFCSGGSEFVPVSLMFGIVCLCTLTCYALPNVGTEFLAQLQAHF